MVYSIQKETKERKPKMKNKSTAPKREQKPPIPYTRMTKTKREKEISIRNKHKGREDW